VRGSRHIRWSALAAALLSTLLATGSAGADDDVAAGLLHPLQAHRRATEQALAQRADADAILLKLVEAPDTRLRAAAWRVVTSTTRHAFAAQALAALADPSPAVGVEAARALLAITAAEHAPTEPRIPAGTLERGGRLALAHALEEMLETAPATELPKIAFKLGEGVVPSLREIAASPHARFGARRIATRLLGRIGGEEAREALVDLVMPWWDDLTVDVLRALCEIGFDEYAARVYWTLRGGSETELPTSWRDFLRPRFRERVSIVFRCIVRSPPPADAESLRDHLRYMIRRRQFTNNPSQLVEMVRALLALGEPTDYDLVLVLKAACTKRNRKHPRAAEMGYALALVSRYREREALQDEARRLLEERDLLDPTRAWQTSLPETVEAWARYFVYQGADGDASDDDVTHADICGMATRLIVGDGEVPTYASRRLGAMLWNEMRSRAKPPRDLVLELLANDDAWVQRYALRWLDRVEDAEATAAVAAGLASPDIDTVVAAAETGRVEPEPAVLVRLLELSVEGHRSQRTRSWRLLHGRVPKSAGDELTQPEGLDERLRSAALLRTALGLTKKVEAVSAGLRNPAGR